VCTDTENLTTNSNTSANTNITTTTTTVNHHLVASNKPEYLDQIIDESNLDIEGNELKVTNSRSATNRNDIG